jgi:phosphinothricin acetyltransferase
MRIRPATPDDAAAIQAIYAPIVRDTAISFETDVPGVDEMRARIVATTAQYPWLVGLDEAGQVCGYVYASRYAERQAYRWSVGVTAYVRSDQRGRGVGRTLYRELLAQLTALGYCQAYAGITLPNPASVGLHEAVGFTPVGVFAGAGHKLGRWYDVGYWQCTLQRPDPPPEPRRHDPGASA